MKSPQLGNVFVCDTSYLACFMKEKEKLWVWSSVTVFCFQRLTTKGTCVCITEGTCVCITEGTCVCITEGTCVCITEGTCVCITEGTCVCITEGTCVCITEGTCVCITEGTCVCIYTLWSYYCFVCMIQVSDVGQENKVFL